MQSTAMWPRHDYAHMAYRKLFPGARASSHVTRQQAITSTRHAGMGRSLMRCSRVCVACNATTHDTTRQQQLTQRLRASASQPPPCRTDTLRCQAGAQQNGQACCGGGLGRHGNPALAAAARSATAAAASLLLFTSGLAAPTTDPHLPPHPVHVLYIQPASAETADLYPLGRVVFPNDYLDPLDLNSSSSPAPVAPGATQADQAAAAVFATSSRTAADPRCPDGLCPGEVNGTLNTCSLQAPSCVSTSSDEPEHFVAPWDFGDGGSREQAVARLIEVATGGYYAPGLSTDDPTVTNGYSRIDAAGYLVRQAVASATGGAPPERPQPRLDPRGATPFDGRLVETHTTEDGSIYVWIRFGAGDGAAAGGPAGGGEALQQLDAEFIFPAGDTIVVIRCAPAALGYEPGAGSVAGTAPAAAAAASASEAQGAPAAGSGGGGGGGPLGSGGRLVLSFERGIEWDTNTSRRKMESLRKALRWEVVPVMADFDPKFNDEVPLWFEQLYAPFRAAPQLKSLLGGSGSAAQ